MSQASEFGPAPAIESELSTGRYKWHQFLAGLGAALCLASSPVFIRAGLEGLPSPLLGVTLGMVANFLVYGVIILFRRNAAGHAGRIPAPIWVWQIVAGALVGLSTWARWVALDLGQVATVVALGRLSVPIVIAVSPLLVGWQAERITARMLAGAALILGGSLLLIFYG